MPTSVFVSAVSAAGTLTGTTLASNVVTSSLTSVGALASGSLTTGFTAVPIAIGGTGAATFKAAGLVAAANLKQAIVTGGAAGNFTVTGVAVGDQLVAVTYSVGAGVAVTNVSDLTAEFTITNTNVVNNTGGTASTNGKLQVWWVDLT